MKLFCITTTIHFCAPTSWLHFRDFTMVVTFFLEGTVFFTVGHLFDKYCIVFMTILCLILPPELLIPPHWETSTKELFQSFP